MIKLSTQLPLGELSQAEVNFYFVTFGKFTQCATCRSKPNAVHLEMLQNDWINENSGKKRQQDSQRV